MVVVDDADADDYDGRLEEDEEDIHWSSWRLMMMRMRGGMKKGEEGG